MYADNVVGPGEFTIPIDFIAGFTYVLPRSAQNQKPKREETDSPCTKPYCETNTSKEVVTAMKVLFISQLDIPI